MILALAVALRLGVPTVTSPLIAQSIPARDSVAVGLVERAAATARRAAPMRANFTQVLTNPRTGTTFSSRGEFFQQGPTRFAFRFADPSEDRIVADGQAIWLYLPSTAKGQVLKLPTVAGAGLDLIGTLLKDPATRYVITGLGDTTLDGRRVVRVSLLPKAPGPFTRAELWLDARTAEIAVAEFDEASGLIRRVVLSKIRRGGSLPADAFRFTPPPGVRVIDQAAVMGGMIPR